MRRGTRLAAAAVVVLVLGGCGSETEDPASSDPSSSEGFDPASATLTQMTIRRPVARALDLGTGCGVQSLHLATHAQQVALTIAKELDVTGILAVELFETRDGRILVNELAMRPHNTGHWTQDGSVTSQFENHLRAVLDLPLGAPNSRERWTVMANVLGGEVSELYSTYRHLMARDPHLKVHLYGKTVRPGRKIGHVNVCGSDLEDLRERARHAADYIQGVIDE